MTRKDYRTVTAEDGLRFKSKLSGSPFATTFDQGTSTMSCFKCGKHRGRNFLRAAKFLGKTQMICKPTCAAVDQEMLK